MKIRYHHLLCIPRYEGKGYNDKFCRNMEEIKSKFNLNEIELIQGPDDVCLYCPNNIDNRCKYEVKTAKYDKLVKNALDNGITPVPSDICRDCEWYEICKDK